MTGVAIYLVTDDRGVGYPDEWDERVVDLVAFVEDERGVLVLGTPGGSRIVSMVLLGLLDYLHNPDWTLDGMVAAPRFHHQFLPDRVEIEPEGFPVAWRTALESRGHTVAVARRRWGNMQAVYVERASGHNRAAADPRGRVEAPAGY